MSDIHPTAIVSKKAKIGNNVTISPFAIINDDVEIGDGSFIGPHVVVYDGARIGKNVKIYQGASIAHRPQDLKFKDEVTYLEIGDETVIHEFATLHRGTTATGVTKIGKKCLLMAYTHVAHDCKIGDNCILANGVQVAGHVEIEDYAIIGGLTPVHQFVKIGKHCMVGGGLRVGKDVPPYIMAAGEPLRYAGLNIVGLRRRGFSNEDIDALKQAYTIFYNSGLNFSQAKDRIMSSSLYENSKVKDVIDFFNKSTRGILG